MLITRDVSHRPSDTDTSCSGVYQVPTEGRNAKAGPGSGATGAAGAAAGATAGATAGAAGAAPGAPGAADAGVAAGAGVFKGMYQVPTDGRKAKGAVHGSAAAWATGSGFGAASTRVLPSAFKYLHMNSIGSSGFIRNMVFKESERSCSMPCFAKYPTAPSLASASISWRCLATSAGLTSLLLVLILSFIPADFGSDEITVTSLLSDTAAGSMGTEQVPTNW
mmetsp:Transcript_17388/g.21383  ORF Transcript_17388/g.21383 Transcript_17388/m.21383 type:complete len:222 (-) Transcript_17388:215-880(-)